MQADASIDSSSWAVPDANGLANTRTRHFYNADGQVAVILPPQAFSNAASLNSPNMNVAHRYDYDLDGRQVAAYSPRYDSTTTSIGGGDDGDTGVDQQTDQCATGRTVDAVGGLGGYGSSVGVCVARTSFDANGNISKQWLPTSNGSDNRYLGYTYTPDNLARVVSGPDPNNSGRVNVSTSEFDGVGRSTKTTDALGHEALTSYTADGLVHQTTGQAYTVDSVAVTDLNTFGYDANGNPKTVTNPKGDTTAQTWTSDNLLAKIQAPGKDGSTFNSTVYGYDNVGNPTSVTLPQQQADGTKPTVNEFTDDNLLKATHTPTGASSYRTVRYAYSPAGMKVATTTAKCSSGTVANCVPNNSAWSASGPGAGTVRLTYGANGRLADQIGRDSTSITTRYAQNGVPTQITDPTSNITITAGYYLDGTVRTVDDGSNANTYAYDAGGQVTYRTDKTSASGVTAGSTISTTYAYNQAGLTGHMASEVLDDVTDYEYDDAGRLVSEETGSHLNEYSWHPNDTLAGTQTTAGGNTINAFTYRYDNNRQITKQIATGDGEKYTNEYGYSPAGNLTSWTHTPTSGGATQVATYEWDRNNNRTKATVAGQITTWTYNADNSITSVDAPGTQSDFPFTYDDGGRLTSDGCTTYTYDDFDRVKKATITSGAGCSADARVVTYTYDGLDRQRTSAVTGSSTANGTTSSIFDGLSSNMVGQKDATNGAHSFPEVLYQLDSTGTAMAMEQTNASAAKSFLDTDGLGNVVNQVTTGNSIACAVVYDPFGGSIGAASGGNDMCASSPPSTSAPTTTGNALWYRGKSRDASTGDYQLGTRTYDPSSGAFTTPDAYRIADPATDLSVGVDPVTANTYSYVNGNPVNFIDPGGHRRVCAGPNDTNCEDVRSEAPTTEDLKKMEAATDKLAAQKEKEARAEFDWEGALKTTLGEVSGVADLKRCVIDGDMGSCFWTIAGIVGASIFKAGKAIKAGAKLLKVYKAFERGRKAAMEAAASYRKYGDYLDEALALSIKSDKAREAQKAKQAATAAKASKKQRAAAVCGFRSFSADTPVLMGDGSHKPIAEIKVGDKVAATDPETGRTATREVTALWIHRDTLTDLKVDGESIRTTEDHPFWSVTDQKFEDAQDLEKGEKVLAADGSLLEVAGLDKATSGEGWAYNLTVDDLHTYYVGHAEVLVHNTNGADCGDAANTAPNALNASSRVAPWAGSSLSRLSREGEVMYRVYGGGAGKAGSWLTPINPLSSAAARQGLALPAENAALYVSRVTLPGGVRMQVGTAGPAFGNPGGWAQAQLLERIPLSSFGKGVPLQ